MAIKLIVADIDGTLLGPNDLERGMHTRTREAITKAVSQNVMFTLATGRSFRSALRIYNDLNIFGPAITLNGAIVRDKVMVYYSAEIDKSILPICTAFAREHGLILLMYNSDNTFYYDTGTSKQSEEHARLESHWRDDFGIIKYFTDEDLPNFEKIKINKILFMSLDAERLSQARVTFLDRVKRGEYPETGDICSSHFDNFEIMPHSVSKGTGVQKLAEAFSIQPDEIMAIGDNENDVEMFRYVGCSVAMGNGCEVAKENAKHVTLSVDEGGVGAAIEKYVLNND